MNLSCSLTTANAITASQGGNTAHKKPHTLNAKRKARLTHHGKKGPNQKNSKYEFSSFEITSQSQPQTSNTPSLALQKKKSTIARFSSELEYTRHSQQAIMKKAVKAIKEMIAWQEMKGETS